MNAFVPTLPKALALLVAVCVVAGTVNDIPAQAKKKAKEADTTVQADAELQKGIEPINTDLTKLMMRLEGRALLSPDEAGKLVDLKYKLLDLVNQHPQNALLAKPLYQAGVIFNQREEYNDAYEMFSHLSTGFPTNPYGLRAKGQIQQLEKRFGADYFVAITPPAEDDAATADATAKPGDSKVSNAGADKAKAEKK